jgi:maltooligosyltrehalose trehalohydrolase
MINRGDGYFEIEVQDLDPDTKYLYMIDGKKECPDPASGYQPEGVHGPSAIVRHDSCQWTDQGWHGLPLDDYIIYEIHVGTFTPEGTFDSAAERIPYLKDLGITAIELMPVAQFPGTRNWGYDGAYPFAVQNSYGGPDGLKRLVDACHTNGLAVILDVVYNHLGPEGNYLSNFGQYFTDRYQTPWGTAVNLDGPYSDGVRRFFIENALHWLETYHIDALRIDAIHGIFDLSAYHFLKELKDTVRRVVTERHAYLICESDLNDVRVISPPSEGGYGIDAQWNDDLHHSLHTLITGEKSGYYIDFGRLEYLAKAVGEGFVYSGQYSEFRKRRHGSSTIDRPHSQFVVFIQNHDQVGNRAQGDRISDTLSLEQMKLAACMIILSPNIPLLFMGEEYGETAPFQYFVSHSNKALVEAVRKGRQDDFASFGWDSVPDPQDEETFLRSKVDLELRNEGRHKELFIFYKEIIRLRKELSSLLRVTKEETTVKTFSAENVVLIKFSELFYAASFNDKPTEIPNPFDGAWRELFSSANAGRPDPTSGNIQGLIRLGPFGFSAFKKDM